MTEQNLARAVLDTAGDAVIAVDATATVILWSAGAEKLFGYPANEVLGKSMALIIPESHRPQHVAGFHAALGSGHLAHEGRPALVEGVAADGRVIPLEMTLGLLPGEDGKPSGVVSVLRLGAEDPVSFI